MRPLGRWTDTDGIFGLQDGHLEDRALRAYQGVFLGCTLQADDDYTVYIGFEDRYLARYFVPFRVAGDIYFQITEVDNFAGDEVGANYIFRPVGELFPTRITALPIGTITQFIQPLAATGYRGAVKQDIAANAAVARQLARYAADARSGHLSDLEAPAFINEIGVEDGPLLYMMKLYVRP